MILQANPDSERRGCLKPLRNATIRCTPRKTLPPGHRADSLYERALTARLESLAGPPGTHPLPIVVDLVDYRRRCTRITRQRNWIAQLANSNRLPMLSRCGVADKSLKQTSSPLPTGGS